MKKSLLLASILLGIMSNAMADDGITIATYGNATGNTTRTMTVAVTHETNNYVAFQFDLTLPEGTTIDATAITAKAPMKAGGTVTIDGTEYDTNFKFDGNTLSDGTYRVIGYNYGNVELQGTSGDVCLTIPLTTTDGVAFDASTVSASNIIFVESENLAGTSLNESGVTTESRLWGDVNNDKTVTSVDVNQASNVYLQKSDASSLTDFFAGDFDSDDKMSSADINKISSIYLQK